MEYQIKFDTVKSVWSLVYIEGSQVIISKTCYISFSGDQFHLIKQCRLLANSADPDVIPLNAALHLGLHCLSKYLFKGFWFTRGK